MEDDETDRMEREGSTPIQASDRTGGGDVIETSRCNEFMCLRRYPI
jgi:hypothetical protein